MKQWLWSAAVLLAVLPATARAQAPAGFEFQVNTYTTGFQFRQDVAMDARGNFIVVWENESGAQLVGRRFNAVGVPQGGEFAVSTYTGVYGRIPRVAAAPDGRFVVVWHSGGQDGSGDGVFGRRFDAAGVPQGGEFQVNTYTTGSQAFPGVTMDASGGFVVVWQGYVDPNLRNEIFARRYDSAGAPLGDPLILNDNPPSGLVIVDHTAPTIDSDAAGKFVVLWVEGQTSFGNPTPQFRTVGRRFDASAAPLGDAFTVGGARALAVADNGDFMVAWTAGGGGFPFPSSSTVRAGSFAADGTPIADNFAVVSGTMGSHSSPSIDADRNGNFVIAWQASESLLAAPDIFVNRFDLEGNPLAVQSRVNTHTSQNQRSPAVASTPDENFVVVWESRYQDGSQYGVFGQRYGDVIFRDGVETGDFTRWSSIQDDGGDLAVAEAAAMGDTSRGIRAVVDDTAGLFARDDSPSAEDLYQAQFYFDPNGFDPGEANNKFRVRLFIAFDESNRRIITLVLRRIGGAYSLMARVRLSDGTRANTPFIPISDAPHFIAFDWRRASSPDAADGRFRMVIDALFKSTLANLDNDASALDSVRLGALTVKPGASGALFYDEFESRRAQIFIF